MRTVDLILKKRNGGELTREEIETFIRDYTAGAIPDYQAAALMMAVWFRGMNPGETADLTLAMANSGDTVDLSKIDGITVDKHSTGGVADTTTLVVAPLVAACGGRLAKMSGRGLGHTGGTLDKLESIPGFRTSQSMDDFIRIVNETGLAVIGQTADLVPADKKLYALRDVTGTIDNVSLIAASIMSKKIASGADAIVLDVKTGTGAFMREEEQAVTLAEAMVEIGAKAGRRTVALVTDMNQPLGEAVGNAIEVREAVEILKGERRGDLLTVSLALAREMLLLAGKAESREDAVNRLERAVVDGSGLEKFRVMVEAQGGDPRVADDLSLLPEARRREPVCAEKSGYIGSVEAADIGRAAMLLGAGRQRKEDTIDPAVGIWMMKRIGDSVVKDEPLAEFHINDEANLEEARNLFLSAVRVAGKKPACPRLVLGRFDG